MLKIFESIFKTIEKRQTLTNVLEKQKQLDDLPNKIRELEIKYETLNNLISNKKNNVAPKWRVIQDKNGETEWIREGQLTYVGKIYNEGNRWCFTVIIDSHNIPFSCESYEAAEQQKLSLLDVERIEKFDSMTK